MPAGRGRVAFGPFCLSPDERLLTREGVAVAIGGRSLDLLTALVEQPGKVLSKRELLQKVWPDVVVEDGSLRFHMAALRKSLGDGVDGARYIATQVGVGYAFVLPVQPVDRSPSTPPIVAAVARPEETANPVGRLPTRMPYVVGREADLRLLLDRLDETRLFTIVGAAGVGKTTLAVEIGHMVLGDFSGRVHFVDLGAVQDPALVPSAIANALRIPVQGEDPAIVVLGHIRTERLLLLFDNCEHLIAEVSSIVERICEAAPDVRILATSREPLRVIGEHLHWLGPLDYPADPVDMPLETLLSFPAVQLFAKRAVAADSALIVDLDSVRRIADICRRLDGMALPIELTAARVATHGLKATAELIGEHFSLGWTGRRTAVARHQTLQATLDWSYDLLTADERRTFERLSIFVGAFSMEAALAVVADGRIGAASAATALDGLIAKSLIAFDKAAGPNPYRLLEMTRTYAREKLLSHDPGDAVATARRHAAYYLALLGNVLSSDGSLSNGTARIVGQIGNIRGALTTSFGADGDGMTGVRLAAASIPVFLNMSLLVECRSWCARALAVLDDGLADSGVELELQAALGLSLMFTRGNSDAVDKAFRRALDIAVALGDAWAQIRILARLHILHERIGDYALAHHWASMAVGIAEAMGEPEAIAVACSLCGISHHLGGDQRQARRYLERAMALALPSERWRTIHYGFDHRNRAIIALSRTCWLLGFVDRSELLAGQAVEEAAGLDHPTTLCIALVWALPIYVAVGDFARAAATLERFAAIAEVNGFAPYIAAVGGLRGNQDVRQGRPQQALGALQESLARLRAARYDLLTAPFTISLSLGLSLVGRHAEALEQVDTAIARSLGNGEAIYMPELLRLKAAILQRSESGDSVEIESLLRQSVACSREQGALAWQIRAASDLALLLSDQGRRVEAAEILDAVRAGAGTSPEFPDLFRPERLGQLLVVQGQMDNWRNLSMHSETSGGEQAAGTG